jgi:hypothetical protein
MALCEAYLFLTVAPLEKHYYRVHEWSDKRSQKPMVEPSPPRPGGIHR